MTCDEVGCSPFSGFPGMFRYQPTVTWDEKAEEWVIVGTASDQVSGWRRSIRMGILIMIGTRYPGVRRRRRGHRGLFIRLGD